MASLNRGGSIGQVFYEVLPKLDGFQKDMERGVSSALDQTTAQVGKWGRRFTLGVTLPLLTLGAGLARQGINALIEQEKLLLQTEARIKSSGGVAGHSAKEIKKMAQELESVSSIEEEVIHSGANILLTFQSITKEGGVFERSLSTALDTSVAFGMSMESAAVMLGKALEDPIRGMAALRRVGVNFTAEQEEQIKNLQEVGNLTEAQLTMLELLSRQVGGSAEALGDSTAGDLAKARNEFDGIVEELVVDMLPVLKDVALAVQDMVAWWNTLGEETQQTILKGLGIAAVVGPIMQVVAGLGRLISTAVKAASALGGVSTAATAVNAAQTVINPTRPVAGAVARGGMLRGALGVAGRIAAPVGVLLAANEAGRLLPGSNGRSLIDGAVSGITGFDPADLVDTSQSSMFLDTVKALRDRGFSEREANQRAAAVYNVNVNNQFSYPMTPGEQSRAAEQSTRGTLYGYGRQ